MRRRRARALATALETRPRWVLGGLIGAQWLAVAVFALLTPRNGWLFYQGGDQTFLYTSAWLLSEGRLPLAEIGFGWPYVLTPIAALAGPNFLDALPLIVLLQVILLLPAALFAIYGIAERIGGRLLGYWAAVLWIVLPYLAIPLFVDRYHERYAVFFVPHAVGLSGLGDFPSMVFVLVSAFFALRALAHRDLGSAAVSGLVAGFAVALKPSNGLFLAAPVAAFLLRGHWRGLLGFGVAAAPAVLALAIWKLRGLGDIPALALETQRYAAGLGMPAVGPVSLGEYVDVDWNRLRGQFASLQEYFWSVRLLEYLPLAGAVAVARRSGATAAMLVLWLAAFLIFKGASSRASVDGGSFFRLLMPGFPAFFLLAASLPLLVPGYSGRRRRNVPRREIRLFSLPVVAALLLLAALPLAVVSVLPPAKERVAVKEFEQQLFVPVAGAFDLRAAREGATVRLRWEPVGGAVGSVHYRVFRSPFSFEGRVPTLPPATEGIQCEPRQEGAADCSLEMTPVADTTATSWTDEPPPGRWTYRIGLLAGWSGEVEDADLFLVGDPLTLTTS